jgi:HEAT repeat protein
MTVPDLLKQLRRWRERYWTSHKQWLWLLAETALTLFFAGIVGFLYLPFLGLFFALYLLGTLIRPVAALRERWYIDLLWFPIYSAGLTAPCFAFILWLRAHDPAVRAGFPLDALGVFPVACVALVIGACGVLTAAVFVILNGFWRLRQLRQLENLPTSKVQSVALGLAEFRGVARSAGPTSDPLLTLGAETHKPFYLEDQTGRILVDPAGAHIRYWRWAHTFAPRVRQIVLTARHQTPFENSRLELRDGDPIYLIGHVQMHGQELIVRALDEKEDRGFFGKLLLGDRLRVSKRDIQHVFFLSDSSEEGARSHIRGGMVRLFIAAAIWIVTSAWMIENQRPRVSDLEFRKWEIAMTARFQFSDAQSEFLMAQLEDPDPRIREYVLDALGFDWGPDSVGRVQAWVRALHHSDPRVRARAAVILGRIHSDPQISIPALLSALDDPDPRVVGDAAAAFNGFKDGMAPAVPRLVELLESDDLSIQPKAFWGLRYARLPLEALPRLQRLLKHSEPEVRREALGAIERMGGGAEAALEDLIRALKDEDGSVRDSAAAAIGGLGPAAERAVPSLIEALGDRRNGDRLPTFAIRALGAIGPAAHPSLPAMFKTLDGGDQFRRKDILYAISRIGPQVLEEAIPHLVEQLQSGNRTAQMAAADCLGEMGRRAQAAVPALEAMIRSGVDGSVQAAGENALKRIR